MGVAFQAVLEGQAVRMGRICGAGSAKAHRRTGQRPRRQRLRKVRLRLLHRRKNSDLAKQTLGAALSRSFFSPKVKIAGRNFRDESDFQFLFSSRGVD
jgi:hypothetical protein